MGPVVPPPRPARRLSLSPWVNPFGIVRCARLRAMLTLTGWGVRSGGGHAGSTSRRVRESVPERPLQRRRRRRADPRPRPRAGGGCVLVHDGERAGASAPGLRGGVPVAPGAPGHRQGGAGAHRGGLRGMVRSRRAERSRALDGDRRAGGGPVLRGGAQAQAPAPPGHDLDFRRHRLRHEALRRIGARAPAPGDRHLGGRPEQRRPQGHIHAGPGQGRS
jgi:hypothetical protein